MAKIYGRRQKRRLYDTGKFGLLVDRATISLGTRPSWTAWDSKSAYHDTRYCDIEHPDIEHPDILCTVTVESAKEEIVKFYGVGWKWSESEWK